jgi:hypothetical protein
VRDVDLGSCLLLVPLGRRAVSCRVVDLRGVVFGLAGGFRVAIVWL